MLPISVLARRFGQTLVDHSPTLLTAAAVTGVATTALLTGRASFKAAEVIRYEEQDRGPLNGKEKAKTVWKLYIPAVITGTATVIFVLGANQVSSRRNAAVLSAYSLTETALKEYKDKVVEQIGSTKEQKIREAISQDRVDQNPPSREIILMAKDDVLFLESITGRYFWAKYEDVMKAQNDMNYKIINDMYASQNDWFDFLKVEPVAVGDDMGWNSNTMFEIKIDAAISTDKRPCMVINYFPMPVPNFHRAF